MNSFVLMARIVRTPEIRYTQDNQMPLAQMIVEFESIKSEDPPTTLKVVGWGKLADEIKENYREGDRVILEGRLTMNVIEHPEGYKEKKAELTASRVHKIGADSNYTPAPASTTSPSNVVAFDSYSSPTSNNETKTESEPFPEQPSTAPARETSPDGNKNLDDIPFLRPVSPRSPESDLLDPWELAANQPGLWLQGNGMLWD